MWMPFSLPRSSMGLPISGASTDRSASRTCSSVTKDHLPGLSCFPRCEPCFLPWYVRTSEPSMSTREPTPLEIHKALADDTRFRLYRHLPLSGRPVPIRELAARLSLHPNTLRPHLRRLEEAGLVRREVRRGSSVGRPQTLYSAVEREPGEGREGRLADVIASGRGPGARARERAVGQARPGGG